MKIQLSTKPLAELEMGFLVLPVFEPDDPKSGREKLSFSDKILEEFFKDHPKFGKLYETHLLYTPKQKILLTGLGKKEKLDFNKIQNWAGTAAKVLGSKTIEFTLIPPKINNLYFSEIIKALVVGMELGLHDPSLTYKTEKEINKLVSVQIIIDKADKEISIALKEARIISEAINLVRTLADLPANIMTPAYFLAQARKIASLAKLKITVLDEKKAKTKGLKAFTAVALGSEEPSYLIAVEYTGDPRSKEKWGLIGKGVTFDSGGLSLKPAAAMQEMKYDMAGAAVVLAIIQAVSQMGFKANLVGICVVSENLPSGKALKPGDIIQSYSGKSVEVLNTDAEGRLLLLDGLSWAQKDFKVNKLVDLATLTSAIVISLGDFITGVFGNDPKLVQDLIIAGAKVGEKFWQLPLDEEYGEMLKSDFADLTNIGHGGGMPGAAGAITAAKFLEQAVEKGRLWIHLDIAGTAWDLKAKPFRGVGATGVGVKTLLKLISGS